MRFFPATLKFDKTSPWKRSPSKVKLSTTPLDFEVSTDLELFLCNFLLTLAAYVWASLHQALALGLHKRIEVFKTCAAADKSPWMYDDQATPR